MKINIIKNEVFKKKSRSLKKRKQCNTSTNKVKTFLKFVYINYNFFPFFLKKQNITLQKNVISVVLLEELGVVTLLSFWLKKYSNNLY